MNYNKAKGHAVRVGQSVMVPSDPTDADIDEALKMMTQFELKKLGQSLSRQIRWAIWSQKHPWLSAFLEGSAAMGATFLHGRI